MIINITLTTNIIIHDTVRKNDIIAIMSSSSDIINSIIIDIRIIININIIITIMLMNITINITMLNIISKIIIMTNFDII